MLKLKGLLQSRGLSLESKRSVLVVGACRCSFKQCHMLHDKTRGNVPEMVYAYNKEALAISNTKTKVVNLEKRFQSKIKGLK